MLYSRCPPGVSVSQISEMIRFWRSSHSRKLFSLHSEMAFSSFRNMPSPEQGASTSTRSNAPFSLVNRPGSLLVTITWSHPHLMMFSLRMVALDLMTSLEINNEFSGRQVASNVDFPPGAAHKSKARIGWSVRTWRRLPGRNRLPRARAGRACRPGVLLSNKHHCTRVSACLSVPGTGVGGPFSRD